MKQLSQIAKELRAKYSEAEIVSMIKNREIKAIEKNGYTEQQNYPNGVYVYTSTEEIGGVLFGSRQK